MIEITFIPIIRCPWRNASEHPMPTYKTDKHLPFFKLLLTISFRNVCLYRREWTGCRSILCSAVWEPHCHVYIACKVRRSSILLTLANKSCLFKLPHHCLTILITSRSCQTNHLFSLNQKIFAESGLRPGNKRYLFQLGHI